MSFSKSDPLWVTHQILIPFSNTNLAFYQLKTVKSKVKILCCRYTLYTIRLYRPILFSSTSRLDINNQVLKWGGGSLFKIREVFVTPESAPFCNHELIVRRTKFNLIFLDLNLDVFRTANIFLLSGIKHL